ncbi:MAG TPA: M20/M25/M40 family metallo-hydrolase [Deltaproteobacteria bacterium]|nr:M20/M25/M40 family metallo-hydrolase [Deltaproteobacteria bacterium]
MMSFLRSIWEEVVSFCQALIRTPSPSGQEGEVAELIQGKMEELPYDMVWRDRVGNIIGFCEGDPNKPSICFTAHMDHVDPGDERDWEYPPYSGVVANGYIHGRGASDLKGPAATQIYIPEILNRLHIKHGDLYIIQVVHEETGGLGSMLIDNDVKQRIDYAINGEPTSNMVCTGHRGRVEVIVTFKGMPMHASIAKSAGNPLYSLGEFLVRLRNLNMETDGVETSSAAPTKCQTGQNSSNVTPSECKLVIDWRNVPGEDENQVLEKLKGILPVGATATIAEYELRTYTGLTFKLKRVRAPFFINNDHPFVQAVVQAVKETLKRPVRVTRWSCATDCGYFMDAGIPIVGFSPAEMKYMHTTRDRISLTLMKEALECYPIIISYVSKLPKRRKFTERGRS